MGFRSSEPGRATVYPFPGNARAGRTSLYRLDSHIPVLIHPWKGVYGATAWAWAGDWVASKARSYRHRFFTALNRLVPAQAANVVTSGVLETFLLSRSPTRGFTKSNGHGRRQPGFNVVGRQGNLTVTSSKQVGFDALREMLIEQVKAQGKEYGLIFEDISGGFTNTGIDIQLQADANAQEGPSGVLTSGIALADFDGDSDLDVLVTNQGGQVGYFANDGSGSYSP